MSQHIAKKSRIKCWLYCLFNNKEWGFLVTVENAVKAEFDGDIDRFCEYLLGELTPHMEKHGIYRLKIIPQNYSTDVVVFTIRFWSYSKSLTHPWLIRKGTAEISRSKQWSKNVENSLLVQNNAK